jgi:hypothetical protein
MQRAIILATLVILASGAADGRPEYTMIGQGQLTCGAWSEHRDTKSASSLQQWMLGFLSGAGFVGSPKTDPLQGVDGLGVFAWVDNYCRGHPLDTIATAGAEFISAHPH